MLHSLLRPYEIHVRSPVAFLVTQEKFQEHSLDDPKLLIEAIPMCDRDVLMPAWIATGERNICLPLLTDYSGRGMQSWIFEDPPHVEVTVLLYNGMIANMMRAIELRRDDQEFFQGDL